MPISINLSEFVGLHRSPLWILVLCTLVLSGCHTMPPSTGESPLASRATLDFSEASIFLPLSEYGMTLDEISLVSAAEAVLYWQCDNNAGHAGVLSEEAISNVKMLMDWKPPRDQWLYGFWAAPYIAANGIVPYGFTVPMGPSGMDPEAVQECREQEDFLSLGVIDTATYSEHSTVRVYNLAIYAGQAWEETIRDTGFIQLLNQRSECVKRQGYSIETGELRSVYTDPSWTEEQTLKAFLTEATCSDEMGFTQQAADINASYEQRLIDAHQAELVTIKNIADERVVHATLILREAGFM